MKKKLFLAAMLATATAPAPVALFEPAAAQAQAAAGASFAPWGIDLAARDPAVRPGDGFFMHVNGNWFRNAVIPADRPGTGALFDLHSRTRDQLRAIIDEGVRTPANENQRKIGALYASFMDEARIEALGARPIEADLARIRNARSHDELVRVMGASHGGFGTSLFAVGVIPDLRGERRYRLILDLGTTGLPDRDYFLTERFAAQREAYAQFIGRTLALIGWPDAEAAAARVLAFEARIAEASWPLTELRDPSRVYNPMTLAELKAYAPGLDWDAYFAAARLPTDGKVIVGQNTAVQRMAREFAGVPLDTLRAWLAFRLAGEASPLLSSRFVESQFAFQPLLSGTPQIQPRWQRGVAAVENSLGEALGEEYVRRHFPPASRRLVQEMVGNLQQAMRRRIEGASWMAPATRAEALRKLDRQRVKVGYPDRWRDYSALRVDPQDLYGNIARAGAHRFALQLAQVGKPLDEGEWLMTPQTLNAYHNAIANEIVFPAAMLQPPMFDPAADAAVNYGAIGAVIGHEITHGFDDQGRRFDADGRLRDWWTPADAARFSAEAARLAAQYDAYEALPGSRVNGRLTLGENIGDQGGLRLALDAYHASLRGRRAPVLNGLSGDQRFFMGWAQGWRNRLRDEMARMLVVTDVHAPYRWRVDGGVRNIDEWYRAFGVRPGQALYLAPRDRVRIW